MRMQHEGRTFEHAIHITVVDELPIAGEAQEVRRLEVAPVAAGPVEPRKAAPRRTHTTTYER